MKRINIFLVILVLVAGFTACDDNLNITNPNYQTTEDFGDTESELEEAVIACYNRIRLEGTYARVGYTMDAVRGDEVWNSSQIWYINADNLNHTSDYFLNEWPWRDNYHVVNRCNFVLQQVDVIQDALSEDSYNQLKGQALFLRGLAYYALGTYYQTCPLITDYADYEDMETMYAGCAPQDSVFDQIEADFTEAMNILPDNSEGEFALGRATCGSAAGYLARTLMFRHKFSEALVVLEDIIGGKYGYYALTADFGDNFKEDTENNSESLFEVQFMDYGTGGTDQEWTPVNISSEATQGHAVEANYGPADFGSWADLAGSPWLYNLYKKEKCTDNGLDPRLYWTLLTYESEYSDYTGTSTDAYPDGDPRSNTVYQTNITSTPVSNTAQGGIAIAKFTNARNNLYTAIDAGLTCGVNIRLMRYSDVLLRAAECINEIEGPTQQAIDYINEVRTRVALSELEVSDFPSADALFEQIANVERPKEFGCENGRGIDLIRWGFFYDSDRMAQISQHSCYMLDGTANTDELTTETADGYSYSFYTTGHEYFPILQAAMDTNEALKPGNSANQNKDNSSAFFEAGYTVRPVYDLGN